jgi:clan AA aspartic protease (TIGR02281 family)
MPKSRIDAAAQDRVVPCRYQFIMKTTFVASALYAATLAFAAGPGHAACGPASYFAPDDADNHAPLARPHGEFLRTQRLAARGNAREARNLAVYYETGYLVSRCAQTAAYWYDRAARQGDDMAKAWLQEQAAAEQLRVAPECYGTRCLASAGGGEATLLRANAQGHYEALVTINGKSVRGMIDTGATLVSMSAKTAAELGIAFANGRRTQFETANGSTTGRTVMLESVTVGNITLRQVLADVSEKDMQLLIGMSFLKRLAITTTGNTMRLSMQ